MVFLAATRLHARLRIVRSVADGVPRPASVSSQATHGTTQQRQNTMGQSNSSASRQVNNYNITKSVLPIRLVFCRTEFFDQQSLNQ